MTAVDDSDKSRAVAPRFNLVDDPWIPVQRLDGTRCELGIRDTLLQADRIAEIQDGSPLVVAALHRLLLAVLYRALEGPTDGQQAKLLLSTGIPMRRIDEYLDKWRPRFNLFDQSYPFGQNPNVPPDKVEPWTKLAAEFNSPTSKTLFDHTDTRALAGRSSNECARWLVAMMTFSVSGGRGYYPSPTANAMMCVAAGQSLAETLLFNLVPYPNRHAQAEDTAVWEREPPTLPLQQMVRRVHGYADLFTWPARFVFLEADAEGTVRTVRFMPAYSAEKSSNGRPMLRDPFAVYAEDAMHGARPLELDPTKETWRSFDSLLPGGGEYAPRTIVNVASLLYGTGRRVRSILVIGQRNERGKADIDSWRMETFTYPGNAIDPKVSRALIAGLLESALKTSRRLEEAMRQVARLVLARTGRALKEDRSVAARWVPGDVSRFVGMRSKDGDPDALGVYWALLERAFHDALVALATLDSIELADQERINLLWLLRVRAAADTAWHGFVEATGTSNAASIRAIARVEPIVVSHFKQLQQHINKLAPEKEPA